VSVRPTVTAASRMTAAARLPERFVRDDGTLPPEILWFGARPSQEVKCLVLSQTERLSSHSVISFTAAPDRKGERPKAHLDGFHGVLHVDGYADYRALARKNDVQLAFCWAHVRRRFYELAVAGPCHRHTHRQSKPSRTWPENIAYQAHWDHARPEMIVETLALAYVGRGDRPRHRRPLHRHQRRRSRQDAPREGLLRTRQCREPDP